MRVSGSYHFPPWNVHLRVQPIVSGVFFPVHAGPARSDNLF